MGTNYYWHPKDGEKLHIGKSSHGWCFSLHVIPERGINDLRDWAKIWSVWYPGYISNEYGDYITRDSMYEIITKRSWDGVPASPEFCAENNCTQGPRGLARHPLSDHCIGHGAGTWDLIVGEFR